MHGTGAKDSGHLAHLASAAEHCSRPSEAGDTLRAIFTGSGNKSNLAIKKKPARPNLLREGSAGPAENG